VAGCRNYKANNIKLDASQQTIVKIENGKIVSIEGKVTEVSTERNELPTAGKSVRLEYEVYALAASMYDPMSGNLSPYLKLGFFKSFYDSMPVKKGQSYCVVRKVYSSSWWNWASFFGKGDNQTLSSSTVIWIGTVPESANKLEVEEQEGTGIAISADGIRTQGIEVNLTKDTNPKP
jgi:hypothetical protein